ncbi:MAG: archaellin/type IV pilin N-terminal domain-containing protein, partial [Candidatus Methanospirareceae archaeon]
MDIRGILRKDKKAFTGLEAAIVLTAFVVVAAVFSY